MSAAEKHVFAARVMNALADYPLAREHGWNAPIQDYCRRTPPLDETSGERVSMDSPIERLSPKLYDGPVEEFDEATTVVPIAPPRLRQTLTEVPRWERVAIARAYCARRGKSHVNKKLCLEFKVSPKTLHRILAALVYGRRSPLL